MKQHFKTFALIFIVMIVSASMVFSGQTLLKKKTPVLMSLIKVDLVSTAKFYMGVCPVTVKMKGTIKVPKAMTVKYYFLRSDGATSKLATLMFRTASSQNVNFSWKIEKDYSGWVQLIVKSPSVAKSAKIGFQVKCDKENVVLHKKSQFKQSIPKMVMKEKEKNVFSGKIPLKRLKPDLIMRISPNSNPAGYKSYFNVIVSNIGKVDTPIPTKGVLQIGLGDNFPDNFYTSHHFEVPVIKAGKHFVYVFEYTFAEAGEYFTTGYINRYVQKMFPETDHSNNYQIHIPFSVN